MYVSWHVGPVVADYWTCTVGKRFKVLLSITMTSLGGIILHRDRTADVSAVSRRVTCDTDHSDVTIRYAVGVVRAPCSDVLLSRRL